VCVGVVCVCGVCVCGVCVCVCPKVMGNFKRLYQNSTGQLHSLTERLTVYS